MVSLFLTPFNRSITLSPYSSLKETTIILFTSAESATIDNKSKNKSSLDTIPSDGTLAKEYSPFVRKIEVEVENLDMVKEAVEAGADIIMLDNMSTEEMQEAIRIIDGRAETECSGNITKENIKTITSLGVDYVSSGALTHSAPILDISLKHLRVLEG